MDLWIPRIFLFNPRKSTPMKLNYLTCLCFSLMTYMIKMMKSLRRIMEVWRELTSKILWFMKDPNLKTDLSPNIVRVQRSHIILKPRTGLRAEASRDSRSQFPSKITTSFQRLLKKEKSSLSTRLDNNLRRIYKALMIISLKRGTLNLGTLSLQRDLYPLISTIHKRYIIALNYLYSKGRYWRKHIQLGLLSQLCEKFLRPGLSSLKSKRVYIKYSQTRTGKDLTRRRS